MKSRWVVVSALIVSVGLAWAVAATDTPSTTSPDDPYLKASTLTTSAPEERKPCTYFNYTCAGKDHGDSCGPAGNNVCYCRVYPGEPALCGGRG